MNWDDYISVDPEICHGKPCIKGTRVLVETIVASLEDGMTADEIHRHYPSISYQSIEALARYAEEQRQAAAAVSSAEPDFQ